MIEELKEWLEENNYIEFDSGRGYMDEWSFHWTGLFNDGPTVKEIVEKFGPYRLVSEDRTDIDKDCLMQVSYFEKYDKYVACYAAYSSQEGTEYDIDSIEEVIPQETTILKFQNNDNENCFVYSEK